MRTRAILSNSFGKHSAPGRRPRVQRGIVRLACAAWMAGAVMNGSAHAGPASATPLLFPMVATICEILDTGGNPACGREIIIGGQDDSPACTINPSDCVHDNNAQFFPFTYGENRMGGVHADDVADLASRGGLCLGGDTAACDGLPYVEMNELVMSKNKVSRLAALRRGTFPAWFDSEITAGRSVVVQLPVIDEMDCEKPATGLEPDRLVLGVVTLDIRELEIYGTRRERFLRAVLVCGVTTNEPGDGIYDFGTSGAP